MLHAIHGIFRSQTPLRWTKALSSAAAQRNLQPPPITHLDGKAVAF